MNSTQFGPFTQSPEGSQGSPGSARGPKRLGDLWLSSEVLRVSVNPQGHVAKSSTMVEYGII